MANPTNAVYRISPYHYIHVLDQNTNITRLEVGPKTYIKQDNETVAVGQTLMITVPYVISLIREILKLILLLKKIIRYKSKIK